MPPWPAPLPPVVPRARHRCRGYRRGLGAAGLGGCSHGGVGNWLTSAARVMPPIHQKMARAASPLGMGGAHLPYPANPHVNYPGLHLAAQGSAMSKPNAGATTQAHHRRIRAGNGCGADDVSCH
jgi:hypothetical protein